MSESKAYRPRGMSKMQPSRPPPKNSRTRARSGRRSFNEQLRRKTRLEVSPRPPQKLMALLRERRWECWSPKLEPDCQGQARRWQKRWKAPWANSWHSWHNYPRLHPRSQPTHQPQRQRQAQAQALSRLTVSTCRRRPRTLRRRPTNSERWQRRPERRRRQRPRLLQRRPLAGLSPRTTKGMTCNPKFPTTNPMVRTASARCDWTVRKTRRNRSGMQEYQKCSKSARRRRRRGAPRGENIGRTDKAAQPRGEPEIQKSKGPLERGGLSDQKCWRLPRPRLLMWLVAFLGLAQGAMSSDDTPHGPNVDRDGHPRLTSFMVTVIILIVAILWCLAGASHKSFRGGWCRGREGSPARRRRRRHRRRQPGQRASSLQGGRFCAFSVALGACIGELSTSSEGTIHRIADSDTYIGIPGRGSGHRHRSGTEVPLADDYCRSIHARLIHGGSRYISSRVVSLSGRLCMGLRSNGCPEWE